MTAIQSMMNYQPFIETVHILIQRAQIDSYPTNKNKLEICLKGLKEKYTKLLSMPQPEMTKGQLMNILRTLDVHIQSLSEKTENLHKAVNFLTFLYLNPLQYPISYLM